MKAFKTEQRIKKITSAVRTRQFSLRIVLENIHDPHNVSAILRTCDAVGVPKIALLYTVEKFPRISRISSASANKWVEREKYSSAEECYNKLRNEGFKIYASSLNNGSKDLFDLDFTSKSAIVLGNEHRGVSEEAAKAADAAWDAQMGGGTSSGNKARDIYNASKSSKSSTNMSQATKDFLKKWGDINDDAISTINKTIADLDSGKYPGSDQMSELISRMRSEADSYSERYGGLEKEAMNYTMEGMSIMLT